MDDATLTLACGLLFGGAGIGYVVFGRRQRRTAVFLAGLGLLVLPILSFSLPVLAATGAVLLWVPRYFPD